MSNHSHYGMGKKTPSAYITGFLLSLFLTLLAFWLVSMAQHETLSEQFNTQIIYLFLYLLAFAQLWVQVRFFLRLNAQSSDSSLNTFSFVFTLLIAVAVVIGTIWIMWNLNSNMMVH